MFILLVIYTVTANDCNQRTQIYNEHGNDNTNYYYFDPNTYTESTKSIDNVEYRKMIQKTVKCTGKWCINDQWKCNGTDNQNCYNVEHIIPAANNIKEISGCLVNIQGNLIMAYGKWNQQLSNEYYGEKALIYGNDIVKSAYTSIYRKCQGTPVNSHVEIPGELCLYTSPFASANIPQIIFLALFFIIVIIVVVYVVVKRRRENLQNNRQSEQFLVNNL